MTSHPPKNVPASVHQRLLNLGQETNRPFNELLQYFAIQRFLFRFGRSEYAEQFVLKGAQMLQVWDAPLARPTMDIDMLGRVSNTVENLEQIVRACATVEVDADGVEFDPNSVRGEVIVKGKEYEGVRIRLRGTLGKIKLNVQVDFGFGDVVAPEPIWIELPDLLGLGAPRLLGYTAESAIAEKFQVLVALDIFNTRIKDFLRHLEPFKRHGFIGRVQGMLKAAQKAKPDLVNWLRPTLKVNRTPEFERRVVEPWEYAALVNILLKPPLAPSRQRERNALWRDAGDAVQLLRMTGGRLNEVLRIKLAQFIWPKVKVRLFASKTENERDLPIWECIRDVVQRRISERLTDGEYLFPRAKVMTFDNAIARACRNAAKLAKLNYGQAKGFTCHSLRHTFVTDMMEATGNDVALVMSYSGHKSIESFKIYLHPTCLRIAGVRTKSLITSGEHAPLFSNR